MINNTFFIPCLYTHQDGCKYRFFIIVYLESLRKGLLSKDLQEMPSFHTKIIESILEPVAQQVLRFFSFLYFYSLNVYDKLCFSFAKKISKLVIIQEDADDKNVMPDLSLPVRLVKQASDNLIAVTFFFNFKQNMLIISSMKRLALKRAKIQKIRF